MQIKFDEGELEGSKYLGAGDHNCRITKIESKSSKKGGKMVEVEFAAASGRTARDWFVTDGNKFKLAALALACGFTKEMLLAGQFDTAMLANRYVRVVREVTGEEAYTDSTGAQKTRKNYENSYLPSASNQPSAQANDNIPF